MLILLICNFYQIGLIQYEFSVLDHSAHVDGVDNIDLKSKEDGKKDWWLDVSMTVTLAWYVSVTIFYRLPTWSSSQHYYYAVVSKNHVYCIKIDRYIGSPTIIITIYCDVERDCPAAIQLHSVFDRPVSVLVSTLTVASVANSERKWKTLRLYQIRFIRLILQDYDKMILQIPALRAIAERGMYESYYLLGHGFYQKYVWGRRGDYYRQW